MGATPGERPTAEKRRRTGARFPVFVDWILGGLVVLTGLSAIVGGGMLRLFVDRSVLVEEIEAEAITVTLGTTELSDAETLEVTEAVVGWTEIGLLATGVVLVLVGLAYIVVRHRAHRRATAEEPASSYGTVAIIGAFATAVLSFIPISPALGGALAGYLERGSSGRSVSVGALAGLLPALLAVAVTLFVLGGLVAGLLAVEEGAWAIAVGAALVLAALFVAIVSAALGAVGGYVGGRLADRWSRPRYETAESAGGRSE
jgi:hypothetical protein